MQLKTAPYQLGCRFFVRVFPGKYYPRFSLVVCGQPALQTSKVGRWLINKRHMPAVGEQRPRRIRQLVDHRLGNQGRTQIVRPTGD